MPAFLAPLIGAAVRIAGSAGAATAGRTLSAMQFGATLANRNNNPGQAPNPGNGRLSTTDR